MKIHVVFVLILILLMTACAELSPEVVTLTTASPSRVSTATATPAPAPTPALTPTPTLTAAQQRDERATAVLTTLPGYDPARHDALLPLALALWGDEYVIDPADVALVVGETAVHAAGQVALRVTSNAAYPAGTLFAWNADSNLLILTGQENSTINRGQVAFGAATLDTWVRYDLDGNVLEFVDPAGSWISPLDLQEDGSFTFYTQEQIGPNGERQLAQTIWWANGGTPIELTTSPIPGQSLTDFLGDGSAYQLSEIEYNGQTRLVITLAQGTTTTHVFNPDTNQWDSLTVSLITPAEYVQQLAAEGVVITHPSVTIPGFKLTLSPRLYADHLEPYAIITSVEQMQHGIDWWKRKNAANNQAAIVAKGESPDTHALLPVLNAEGQVELGLVPHSANLNIRVLSGLEQPDIRLPFAISDFPDWQFGMVWDEANQQLNLIIRLPANQSSDASTGSTPQAIWIRALEIVHLCSWNAQELLNAPEGRINIRGIANGVKEIEEEFRSDIDGLAFEPPALFIFNANFHIPELTSDFRYLEEIWPEQIPDRP